MKKLIAVIGVTLLAGLCSQAKAADHKMTASFLPGVSIPVSGLYASNKNSDGSIDNGMGSSFATAIAVDYQIQDSLALGLEIGRDWQHSPKQFPAGFSGDEISLWQITPYAKYSFKTMGKITPYAVFGVGMYSFHQNLMNLNGYSYSDRTKNYLGFNIGGGATYALTKDWELGLDVRWHHVFANVQMDDLSNPPSSPFIAINNITPSIKLQYNFSL